MIITKQMTENDILRTNIQYYWNNFSESEQKWLIGHVALEQDKVFIYKEPISGEIKNMEITLRI